MQLLTRFTIFERAVVFTIAATVIATLLAVALGDNVGVQIARFGPDATASRSSVVSIQFTEEMDRASVEERFEITPPLPGEISWSGSRLLFSPQDGFEPGREYLVSVQEGAESSEGRDLLDSFEFGFRVRGARIAFLNASDNEIWIADPSGSTDPEIVVSTSKGVAFFDVTADGTKVLFRERGGLTRGEPKPQLMMTELSTGRVVQLTFIESILISDAAWNHDGSMIAFSSSDEGPLVPGDDDSPVTVSPPRTSLLDLSSSPPVISRLLRSNAESADNPRWSPAEDVLTVGVTPLTAEGQERLTVVDLDVGPIYSIDTDRPETVSFSEDGLEFVVLVRTDVHLKSPTEIWKVETASGRLEEVALSDDFDTVRDTAIAWRPGHSAVAVMREATDGTELPSSELHLVDLATGASVPLIADPEMDVRAMEWNPSGSLLAVDLVRGGEPEPVQQIAVLDVDSNEIVTVLENASGAIWVP